MEFSLHCLAFRFYPERHPHARYERFLGYQAIRLRSTRLHALLLAIGGGAPPFRGFQPPLGRFRVEGWRFDISRTLRRQWSPRPRQRLRPLPEWSLYRRPRRPPHQSLKRPWQRPPPWRVRDWGGRVLPQEFLRRSFRDPRDQGRLPGSAKRC